jgi:hypothetical protein
MASYDQSITDVFKSAVRDAQELVQGEIQLARAEFRQELRSAMAAVTALATAAVAGVVGLVFLLTAAARFMAVGLEWPIWAGFAVVGVGLALAAAVLAVMGKRRLAVERRMPLTMETLKENMQWMRARSS